MSMLHIWVHVADRDPDRSRLLDIQWKFSVASLKLSLCMIPPGLALIVPDLDHQVHDSTNSKMNYCTIA
jgi:hypothetical protein